MFTLPAYAEAEALRDRWAVRRFEKGALTSLVDALATLGLGAEVTLAGRWARLAGERCAVYVVEARLGGGYFAWCAAPCEQTVEHHRDPIGAIESGLRRAGPARVTGADPVDRAPVESPPHQGGSR